jgi:hypothetical protein
VDLSAPGLCLKAVEAEGILLSGDFSYQGVIVMKVRMWVSVFLVSCLAACSDMSTKVHEEVAPEKIAAVGERRNVEINADGKASVQVALSDGPGVAGLINTNYNENTTSCTEYGTGKVRGYYFCTGVLLRTTDNGNFNPWESSPAALDLRATSYSWIRHDFSTDNLYKRAGLIFLNPADILAQTVPGLTYPKYTSNGNPMVKCIYPFDAWTQRVMNRGYFACDAEGTGLGSPISGQPWGSCDNKLGYSSAAQWDDYFRSSGQINYKQCSWNADNPQGWRNAIASHNVFTGQSSWNEVMVDNFGHNPNLPTYHQRVLGWTVAVFYDVAKAGGRDDARVFQQKMANAGKRVPILRLNFSAAPTDRFQYVADDQSMYP